MMIRDDVNGAGYLMTKGMEEAKEFSDFFGKTSV